MCAPRGTGRHAFARDWAGDEVFTPADLDEATRGRLRERAEVGLPSAVVVDTQREAAAIVREMPCRVAWPSDLLLSPSEIARLCTEASTRTTPTTPPTPAAPTTPSTPAPTTPTTERLYRLTGGWLSAVRELAEHGLDDPGARRRAIDAVGAALVPWLLSTRHPVTWTWVAHLDRVSDEVLTAISHVGDGEAPDVARLARLGLVRPVGDGWRVPDLIVQALTARSWAMEGLDGVDADDVVTALADGGRFDVAIGVATKAGVWRGLRDALADNWADAFNGDPRRLRDAIALMPRRWATKLDGFAVAARVLLAIGRERMDLPLPTTAPDLAHDDTARDLRARMQVLRTRPNARALTFGLIEQAHLRLSGHAAAAADTAGELRATLERAVADGHVRPGLATLVELQAGISLHLEQRMQQAARAYVSAYQWSRSGGRSRLGEVNAAANLALLAATDGDPFALRRWLHAVDDAAPSVGWGREMAERTATLARGQQAVWAMDASALHDVLEHLPGELDNDEFWPVHLWLQVQADLWAGQGARAHQRLAGALIERRHAAASAMARRYLGHAMRLVELVGTGSAAPGGTAPVPPGGEPFGELPVSWWPESEVLDAVAAIRCGDEDRAFGVLTHALPRAGRARVHRPLAYLRDHVREGGVVSSAAADRIRAQLDGDGAISDLIPLHLIGASDALREAGAITSAEYERLHLLAPPPPPVTDRPVLTPREQDVLAQLRQGLTRREIADRLHRSENTVKSQLRSLYRKLDASTQHEALEAARRFGW